MLQVAALHVYPVKSCRGVDLPSAELTSRGFRLDRRYMIVDADGTFVTQRRDPKLTPVTTELSADRFVLAAPGLEPLSLPHEAPDGPRMSVTVWSSSCRAVVHSEGSDWFSRLLGRAAHLVFMPDDVERAIDPDYAEPGEIVSFADGYPVMVLSEESLSDLNARLPEPVTMERFRPSIVLRGGAPYAEDGWKRLRLGDAVLRLVKLCARCVLTTRDPRTGVAGKEPLRTLATYRRLRKNKVCFGVNAIPEGLGSLRVGDPVTPV